MNVAGLLNSLMKNSSGASRRGNSLEQLAGSFLGGNNANIGGMGALAGSLLGGGTKSVKGALGGGALAILGSMAFKAFQNNQQQKAGNQQMDSKTQLMAGMREPETPEEEKEVHSMMLLILKAMINAAKADGHIDDDEMNKIVGKAKEDGLSDEEQSFIMEEINKPMDTAGLIAAVSDPQVAAQIYTASLLAIVVDTDEERAYLKELATGLGLSDSVVSYLHSTVGV